MRLYMEGRLATFLPIQKKVAFALYFFSSSSTNGVAVSCGPSSKVRYNTFSLVGIFHIKDEYNPFSHQGAFIKYIAVYFSSITTTWSGLSAVTDGKLVSISVPFFNRAVTAFLLFIRYTLPIIFTGKLVS